MTEAALKGKGEGEQMSTKTTEMGLNWKVEGGRQYEVSMTAKA